MEPLMPVVQPAAHMPAVQPATLTPAAKPIAQFSDVQLLLLLSCIISIQISVPCIVYNTYLYCIFIIQSFILLNPAAQMRCADVVRCGNRTRLCASSTMALFLTFLFFSAASLTTVGGVVDFCENCHTFAKSSTSYTAIDGETLCRHARARQTAEVIFTV